MLKIKFDTLDVKLNAKGQYFFAYRVLKTTSKGATGKYWGKKLYASMDEINKMKESMKVTSGKTVVDTFKSVKSEVLINNIKRRIDTLPNFKGKARLRDKIMDTLNNMPESFIADWAKENQEYLDYFFYDSKQKQGREVAISKMAKLAQSLDIKEDYKQLELEENSIEDTYKKHKGRLAQLASLKQKAKEQVGV